MTAGTFQRELERSALLDQRVEGQRGALAVAAVGRPGEGHVAVFTSFESLAG